MHNVLCELIFEYVYSISVVLCEFIFLLCSLFLRLPSTAWVRKGHQEYAEPLTFNSGSLFVNARDHRVHRWNVDSGSPRRYDQRKKGPGFRLDAGVHQIFLVRIRMGWLVRLRDPSRSLALVYILIVTPHQWWSASQKHCYIWRSARSTTLSGRK
jgi:hypothetical protein